MLDILKFLGVVITTAGGIVSLYTTKAWEVHRIAPAILAPGHDGEEKRRMTTWGYWSLGLMIFGFFIASGAQVAESARTKQKERLEREEKEALEKTQREQITRIQRENQEEMAKRLGAQSVQLAEMFFQGRELDSQRAAFLEKAKLAGVDVKIPERSNSLSMSNLSTEIRKALKSIPEELRAASLAKSLAESERVATQSKAKELDKAIRPHVLNGWALIQSVLAQAQQEGLITVTNIGLIPTLPDRLVYSRHETNFGNRLERFFGSNYQQRIAFAHAETWLVSMLPGILDSSTQTNGNYYPRIWISRPRPNLIVPMPSPLSELSFDPANAEIRIAGSGTPQEPDTKLSPEDRVATALVDLLRRSLLQSRQ